MTAHTTARTTRWLLLNSSSHRPLRAVQANHNGILDNDVTAFAFVRLGASLGHSDRGYPRVTRIAAMPFNIVTSISAPCGVPSHSAKALLAMRRLAISSASAGPTKPKTSISKYLQICIIF